jgi:magnesium chelatase family protein
LHVEVPALPTGELLDTASGESSRAIRLRSTTARDKALARQSGPNQTLAPQELERHAGLDDAARKFLQFAATQLAWSARSTHRTLKIARTIADLAGSDNTQLTHVAEAMQYRRVLRSNH